MHRTKRSRSTETQWGPVIAKDADGTPLALAWTALRPGALDIDLMHLATAETVDEAIAIANDSGMPAQNFVVGDHVRQCRMDRSPAAYRNASAATIRCCRRTGASPAPAGTAGLPPQELPRLVQSAPISASGRPISASLEVGSRDLATLGDGGYDLGARARQIRDDMRARSQFAPDDMLTIQLDDRALLLAPWHDMLGEVDQARRRQHRPLGRAKKYFDDWNEHADPKSVGYRLVRDFRREVTDTVIDGFAAAVRAKDKDFKMPKLPQAEAIVDTIVGHRPPHLLPPTYTDWNDLLQKCAERVVKKLDAMPGGLAARTWGDANATRIRHALSKSLPGMGWLLDMPRRELPGDANMPRVQSPDFGASERFAVEPGFEQYGYFHMPGGQSDNPLSPFYGAGDADWAHGKADAVPAGCRKVYFYAHAALKQFFHDAQEQARQRLEFVDGDAFVDLVDRRVDRTDLDHFRAHRRDEARIRRAAAGVGFGTMPQISSIACDRRLRAVFRRCVRNGSPDTFQSIEKSRPCLRRIASVRSRRLCDVLAVQKRKLKSTSSAPGTTLCAPVPALMFEIWNEVGGNSALPSSQCVAASSASAGAARWIGLRTFSGYATWPCTPRTVSLPDSEPRRPTRTISPSRSRDDGSPTTHQSMR